MLSIEPNERVTFGVRHQDPTLIVVDKPSGVVTNTGVGHDHDTLVNGLFARWGGVLQNMGKERDFGLLHRLDRETSGLVAVATTQSRYDELRAAFAERRVRKFYYAICHKPPRDHQGVIKRAIIEDVKKRDRYTSVSTARISREGKPALTAYRVLSLSDTACLIEARPITGRLHQVRVHLASIGAGILGDELYGPRKTTDAARRLALHAHRLVLPDHATGEDVDVKSNLPRDLKRLLTRHGLELPGWGKSEVTDEVDLDETETTVDDG